MENKQDFGTVHVPVMADEVVRGLAPEADKVFVDGTLGGGGHARLLLDAGAVVLGFDQDKDVVARAGEWGKPYGERLRVTHANFAEGLDALVQDAVMVDGILLDLGMSSDQLDGDEAEAADGRGFSYKRTADPLDMRMNVDATTTAADILNTWDEAKLTQMFFDYAEEPRGRALAKAVVAARSERPFKTSGDLLQIVEKIYPLRFGLKRSHPAGRIFQALRIAVNDELTVLARALPLALQLLKPGGRLCIITFHSLEDRMVKKFYKNIAVDELDSVGRVATLSPYKIWKKQMPTARELEVNPRARSAHVRVIERIT